ncbi:hypothetical protein NP233_g11323 [Leucocoprinus birnbaumii]|uniref:AAA+ ATPase domain-containing protein n=1 Tax=Leucocoprinus birnbaumii TaxID=56174 RepID=A0AAD5YKI8_9AGAR|nr:hypothetical protein NP233_g11323 [Leucocoprinus birnbaumii]
MTATNDDKRKPTTSESKATKSGRTLLDMFVKKLERTTSQQNTSRISTPLTTGNEEGDPPSEETIIPGSADTINSNDTLGTTPKRKPASQIVNESEPPSDLEFEVELTDSEIGFELDAIPSTFTEDESSQGSRDAPIIVTDSSPIKSIEDPVEVEIVSPIVELPKKPFHPFFAPRNKDRSTVRQSPRRHRTREPEAAYPDRESLHVKGDQTSYSSPPCPFERRHANANTVVGPGLPFAGNTRTEVWVENTHALDFLLPHKLEKAQDPHDGVISPTSYQEIPVQTINPNLIREHPAIKRVVDSAKSRDETSTSSGQLWTDAWRPRCAKEILGNEHSAIYLRNWLYSLAIQLNPVEPGKEKEKKKRKKAKKRPRVVREVARKKPRRDGLGEFIAEDDEEDDVDPPTWNMDEEDELMNYQGESSQHSGADETLPSAFATDEPEAINERLHNTILLTGPPGSGKTAAVFACAEELGWEVFEVYPGIGRRNGANVDNLVGEVGKNHLVRKKTGATGQVSIATLLSRNAGLEGETEGWTSSGEVSGEEGQQGIRQSVILLEEVDVLFKDDVNFWPAVTNLIKECRRPVICTCNGKETGTGVPKETIADGRFVDASLVPQDELPLQRVLHFEPCNAEVGTAYLEGLASAEGYTVPRHVLRQIYCDTYELSGADIPRDLSAPTAHCELPQYDLRRAIHRVQMGCTTGGRWEAKNSTECQEGSRDVSWEISHEGVSDRCRDMREMDGISQQADLVSIVDVWGGRKGRVFVRGKQQRTRRTERVLRLG